MREPVAPRRFDERGIALQTVIIIVVMLAIAGAVAGVLLNRAGQVTDDLAQTTNIEWEQVNSETACRISGTGGNWHAKATNASHVGSTGNAAAQAAEVHSHYGNGTHDVGGTDHHCHPLALP